MSDRTESEPAREVFIGDGLYASFEDGFSIRLRAPRERGDHEVWLEPSTFANLLDVALTWGPNFAAAIKRTAARLEAAETRQ